MKRYRGTGADIVEPGNRIGRVDRGEGKNCVKCTSRHGKIKNYLNCSREAMNLGHHYTWS